MIYWSSGIFLLAQTWSLNVKLILATTARMTITGIFPFCFHVLCNIHACNIHVFCNSTCVQQLSLYCKCLSVADRQQCCTGWSMVEFLTRVKKERRRKESLPVKGLLDIYFRFATCILFICPSHQYLWFQGRMQLPIHDLRRKHECFHFNFSFSGPAQSTKTEFGGFRWTVWKSNF